MNTNYNFNFLFPYAIIFLFVYLFNSILFLYLPKKPLQVDHISQNDIKYSSYNGFFTKEISIIENKEIKKEYLSIDKIVLKAIYLQNENIAWAVMQEKNSSKTKIVSLGEEYKSYILKKVFKTYVILEKYNKEYKIILNNMNTKLKYSINKVNKEDLFVSGNEVIISRKYLNSYINDLSKVWNNISINEIRKNGKIDGFKVFKVKENSVFEKIGLKKDDIIKKVNNKPLDSYNEAFKLYKNINKINYFVIEILRNNEIMELSYEIN